MGSTGTKEKGNAGGKGSALEERVEGCGKELKHSSICHLENYIITIIYSLFY